VLLVVLVMLPSQLSSRVLFLHRVVLAGMGGGAHRGGEVTFVSAQGGRSASSVRFTEGGE
jgi:hypothetical protein